MSQNHPQRVSRCSRCGGQVVAGERGPLPRLCRPCKAKTRKRRQLRHYLAASLKLAREELP